MDNDRRVNLQYDIFDWIKVPLILCVIFIHNFDVQNYALTLKWENCGNIFMVAISHVLAHIAVPCFFIISGYLFFRDLKEWDWSRWKDKLSRRFYTLFIPYVLWILIYVLFDVILGVRREGVDFIDVYLKENNGFHLFWDCHVWNSDQFNIFGQSLAKTSPISIPLWYLRDLMVVTLLTPILFFLLRLPKSIGILLLFLGYLLNVSFVIPGLSIRAFFFFGLGGHFAIRQIDMVASFKKWERINYMLYLPLFIVEVFLDGSRTFEGAIIFPFFITVGCIAAFNIASHFVESGRMSFLRNYSNSVFFVYVSHELILGYLRRFFDSFAPRIVSYLIVPFITMGLCVIMYRMITKLNFPIGKLLTGKR